MSPNFIPTGVDPVIRLTICLKEIINEYAFYNFFYEIINLMVGPILIVTSILMGSNVEFNFHPHQLRIGRIHPSQSLSLDPCFVDPARVSSIDKIRDSIYAERIILTFDRDMLRIYHAVIPVTTIQSLEGATSNISLAPTTLKKQENVHHTWAQFS